METLLTPDDLIYREECRNYASGELTELAKKFGEVRDVPEQLRYSMARRGLFKHLVPEKYGGSGLSSVRICLAREMIAGAYAPADVTLAMQGLGTYPIVRGGSDSIKQKYLPLLSQGSKLASFALTEPNAGSDISDLQAIARKANSHFALTGTKRFISNGYSADMFVAFAKVEPSNKPRAISAFLLDKATPGFEIENRLNLICSHDIVSIRLNNAIVPTGHLLGKIGDGLKLALETLDLMRMTVGAAAVGMAQTAFDQTVDYASKRIQFGRPIVEHQVTKFKLADMITELEAARLLVYRAALRRDRDLEGTTLAASMAKLFATETACRIIDQAVQIHGGVGLMKGSVVERLYREIRPLRIYEGTSEIQKLIIFRHLR
jgi:acyl-CoA dehydrogenase